MSQPSRLALPLVLVLTVALFPLIAHTPGVSARRIASAQPVLPAPQAPLALALPAAETGLDVLVVPFIGAGSTADQRGSMAVEIAEHSTRGSNGQAGAVSLRQGNDRELKPARPGLAQRQLAPTPVAAPPPPPTLPPAPRATPAAADQAHVPIIMYHHIGEPPPGADPIRLDLTVRTAEFAEQLDWLAKNGYETISLDDLLQSMAQRASLPRRPIILTFDDGYDDNYTIAYPMLKKHGFSATFFIITDVVGHREYMSWEQIVDMSKNGMSIQSHSRTHIDQEVAGPEDNAWQIAGSRAKLEEKVGRPVRYFCYPAGRYGPQTIAALQASGYLAAVTTRYGATQRAAAPFELPRVRIHGGWGLQAFISAVLGAP